MQMGWLGQSVKIMSMVKMVESPQPAGERMQLFISTSLLSHSQVQRSGENRHTTRLSI